MMVLSTTNCYYCLMDNYYDYFASEVYLEVDIVIAVCYLECDVTDDVKANVVSLVDIGEGNLIAVTGADLEEVEKDNTAGATFSHR